MHGETGVLPEHTCSTLGYQAVMHYQFIRCNEECNDRLIAHCGLASPALAPVFSVVFYPGVAPSSLPTLTDSRIIINNWTD